MTQRIRRTNTRCAARPGRPAAKWKRWSPHSLPSHKHRASQYRFPTPVHSSSRLRVSALHAAHVRSRAALPANTHHGSHGLALLDPASANAKVPVDHRRIVENENLFPRRRAILLYNLDFPFDELRGQFAGIRNRGRAADELRIRTVELCDASQPPEHVR